MKKVIMVVAILAVTGVALAVIGYNLSKMKSTGLPVEVAEVKSESIVSKINAEGMVKLNKNRVVTASNSADVKKVNVKVGDVVKAGDVLVVYDEDALTSLKNQLADAKLVVKSNEISLSSSMLPATEEEINQAQSSISQAEKNIEKINWSIAQIENNLKQQKNNLDTAQKDYDSNVILFEAQAISKSELDTFKNKLDTANTEYQNAVTQLEAEKISLESEKANLETAKTSYNTLVNKLNTETVKNNIEQNKVQLEQAKLNQQQIQEDIDKFNMVEVAPIDGTITAVNIADGGYASEGAVIIEMSNINDCIVEIDVPEYDMANVKVGEKAIVTGDGIEGEIEGVVSKISPIAFEKTSSGTTKQVVSTEIDVNDKSKLIVGFTVKADIITSTNPNATVIPIMSYLTDDDGIDYVFIVDEESKLKRRDIKVLTYNNNNVEVSGVEVGETVVDNPNGNLLKEGMQVSVPTQE